ncbi:MAG: hypothetical protein K9I34_02540 [Bacteroidales bacterium]|nr:hypothetical protein [Bacteroidales bacterium]
MKSTPARIYSLLFFLTLSYSAFAQVSVAPTVIIIDDQTGVASLQVDNSPDAAKEIQISFDFGYPASDSLGNVLMVYGDSVNNAKFGLDPYLRIFPKNFILQPGAQQTVRIQVRPMTNKADGTYWTRLVVNSSVAAKDIETVNLAEGVGTQINYVFKQNIPVLYTKGAVTTGVQVDAVQTQRIDNKLEAVLDLKLLGNSPFLGTLYTRFLDDLGMEIAMQQQTFVAYFDVMRKVELELPEGTKAGNYTLELTFETKRNDIPVSDLVKAETLVYKHPVSL